MTPWGAEGAVRLSRYPRAVREALSPRGRWVGELLGGAEIRFVTDAPTVRLHITAGLSCDLVHPSDHGHIQMGENLAKLLGPMLNRPEI